jgi:hypothetical protein
VARSTASVWTNQCACLHHPQRQIDVPHDVHQNAFAIATDPISFAIFILSTANLPGGQIAACHSTKQVYEKGTPKIFNRSPNASSLIYRDLDHRIGLNRGPGAAKRHAAHAGLTGNLI